MPELETSKIFIDHDFNCRGDIAPFDVIELARSIETHGLQQPIVVQPYTKKPPYEYRILMGHRRFVAVTKILKKTTIKAEINSTASETEAIALNLIENTERKSLNIMQEAKAIQRFHIAGCTIKETARLVGKPEHWVTLRFTALKLPKDIQDQIAAGFINQEQIKDIHNLPSKEQQYAAVRHIIDSRLKGEKNKIKIAPPKKISPFKKAVRSPQEIFRMQDIIRETVGNNFGTRCLAWASGMIPEVDLLRDLKEIADEKGVPYQLPPEVLGA